MNKPLPLFLLSLAFLAAENSAFGGAKVGSPKPAGTPSARVMKEGIAIDDICKGLDESVKNKALPYKIFVDVGGKPKAHWQKFRDEKEVSDACDGGGKGGPVCFSFCTLFYQGHRPVLAACTFTSPSGDWVTYANYYFRANGTLMKAQSDRQSIGAIPQGELGKAKADTHPFSLQVMRADFYDLKGKCFLSLPAKYYDLDNHVEVSKPSYAEGEWPPYRKLKDLPFYSLIAGPKRN